jgi:hypothetical protein
MDTLRWLPFLDRSGGRSSGEAVAECSERLLLHRRPVHTISRLAREHFHPSRRIALGVANEL